MSNTYKVLLICGSTRKHANSGKLLHAVEDLAPKGLTCTTYNGINELPNYNEDLDKPDAPPAAVKHLRDAISHADAVIIASPEYNHSIPGGLKNALDWASRPYGAAPLTGKCMALFVSTKGHAFGFNGLAELRRICSDMVNFVVAGPQVVVHDSESKLVPGEQGRYRLDDPMGCHLIRAQLHGLHAALEQNAGALVRAPYAYLAKNKP